MALREFPGELVGLPGGGAVADRDQLHLVLPGQPLQRGQSLVPPGLRLVRVNGVGGDHLAGAVDHRHLHPGAVTGVQTDRRAGARGRREQEVPQVRGEHPHRLVLGGLPQPHPQVDAQMQQHLGAPRPAHRLPQPAVGGPALVGDAEPRGDAGLVLVGVRARLVGLGGHREDLLLLPAQQCEHAVRGELRHRFGEVEVVGELGALGLLALAHRGGDPAARPHPLAQLADQVGVLGEPFDQNGARPGQGGVGVGDPGVGVDERLRGALRVLRRVVQQGVRQRFEPGLPGDLALRPPLRPVRQVDVLQPRLLPGGPDAGLQLRRELALRTDRVEDHRAAVLQLPQVPQALLQRAQLGVVERPGRFLAVARDERHRRAVVEQRDGRGDLPGADAELVGDRVGEGRVGGRAVSHDTDCAWSGRRR